MRTRGESFVGSRSASSESGMPEHRLTSECAECSPTQCHPQGLKRGFATQDGLGRSLGARLSSPIRTTRCWIPTRSRRTADRRTDTSSAMRATRCSCRTATAACPSTRRPRRTGPGRRRRTAVRSRSRACLRARRPAPTVELPTRSFRSSHQWPGEFSDSAHRRPASSSRPNTIFRRPTR